MLIRFSPVRSEMVLQILRHGDMLTVNGVDHDFGPLAEGAVLPQAAVAGGWLASDVTRREGRLELTVLLPHGAEAPPELRFPAPLLLQADGPLPRPQAALPAEVQA